MKVRTYIGIALIGAALAVSIGAANATPLQTAIGKLYAAPNSVQRAVDLDACQHWDERAEHKTARAKLSRPHAVQYDAIQADMHAAFAATNGTDSAVESVLQSFCDAVANR